ncbi:MAG: DNA polymerase III subunit beta [Beijerinckiaceae bacterium]
MKFQAERADLLAAVKRACSVVPSRTTIPILSCVLIEATDTGGKVVASDLDQWITVSAKAAVSQPGSTCLPAHQLESWLAATPKGALISLEVVDDRAVLVAGSATASFGTLYSEDFPVPAARDTPVEVPSAIPALAMCLPYVSNEETRYYLNGVALSGGHAVATNGYIGCAVDIGCALEHAPIIPTDAVRQIIQSSPSARLFMGENTWACEDEGVLMGGKLIDGVYPDWSRVFASGGNSVSVDADAMSDAIKLAQVASGERARAIVLTSNGQSLSVDCRGEAMTSGSSVPCADGEFRVGMNSKYALTAMATFAGRVVNMMVDAKGGPVGFTCDMVPELRVSVMPMRV